MVQKQGRVRQSKNYEARFFKKKYDETGQFCGFELIGTTQVDDNCTGPELPLITKAFRQAPASCALADKIQIEQVR